VTGPQFGVRREPPPDPDAVGEDEELVARIRVEIAATGPMTFARFMALALYEPGHGYYRRPEAGPGMAGADFLTAPEAHPIFGATIGRLLEDVWAALGRPDPFVVTEHGAGTGTLALGLFDGLRRRGSDLAAAIRYRPTDVEPGRIATLADRLGDAGYAGSLHLDPPVGRETGAILANEVLDALPVHRVVMRDTLRERFVIDTGDRFGEADGDPSTPDLHAHLEADGVQLARDQVTEIPLDADAWVAGVSRQLARGFGLLIDYGAEARDLHGPSRPTGSLRAFARHTVTHDPFVRIGRQDLTTHVCLAGVRRAIDAAGLRIVGETTQAELLAAAGAGDDVRDALTSPDASLESAFALRSALARLLDPRVMGGYRVVGFGRGLPEGYQPVAFGRLARPG
jgi:SAM-dependent MidA family methyltransferase